METALVLIGLAQLAGLLLFLAALRGGSRPDDARRQPPRARRIRPALQLLL